MEIPTYYSFNEFVENYETDFTQWLEIYPDGDEENFINEVKANYNEFDFYMPISISEIYEEYPQYREIDFLTYLGIIENRVNKFILKNELQPKTESEFLSLITAEIFDDGDNWKYNKYDRFQIPYKEFSIHREFVKGEIDFLDNFELLFNDQKFKSFTFTIKKIIAFLQNRTENPYEAKVALEKSKITINGNTQLLGHIFIQLIEGGFIEPIKTGTGEINKTATTQSILDHFEFTENEKQPSVEYLKKAIFHNQFSTDKTEYLKILPLKNFN